MYPSTVCTYRRSIAVSQLKASALVAFFAKYYRSCGHRFLPCDKKLRPSGRRLSICNDAGFAWLEAYARSIWLSSLFPYTFHISLQLPAATMIFPRNVSTFLLRYCACRPFAIRNVISGIFTSIIVYTVGLQATAHGGPGFLLATHLLGGTFSQRELDVSADSCLPTP